MQNTEIERKYLLRDDSWRSQVTERHELVQGYLAMGEGNTIRIRRMDDKAYLTVKSRPAAGSITRFEWEREVSVEDFRALFPHCVGCPIEKTRHIVPLRMPSCMLRIEIDEFHGRHEGLIFAEIELPSEDTAVELPPFIGEEVTGDRRYYNSYLSSKE